MFRSIRAAIAKSRAAKTKENSRKLLLESLEQRRLMSVSPGLAPASLSLAATPAFYGPAFSNPQGQPRVNLQPEGEGQLPSTSNSARQLLFAGIAGSTASPTNSGLLTIIDSSPNSPTNTIVPWKAPLSAGGIAGLAFDLSGRLFATIDEGPCTTSELVELNPADGTVIRRLPVMAGSSKINIGDLAIEPSTGRLFGTRSVHDDANHAGELFVIDVDSGAATFVGDTGTGSGEALAFAADGTLYLAGTSGGKPVLYKIDPATAEPHQRDPGTGLAVPFVVLNDPTGRIKRVEGLVGHPDDGTLIATTSMTRFAANQIVDDTYSIDISTGTVTARPLASPARGIFGDIAFQPSPRVLDIIYQENFESGNAGFVVDNTGGTLPGLWHYSLGRRFDSLPSHTPISSFYYGAFETGFGGGHYVLPLDHQGTLTSAPIQLPTSSMLSFSYLLDVRPELDVDFVDVSVIAADGTVTKILSRADGTLPQTGRQQWRTATADLSAFACQPIQLQFSFDTGAVPQIDPEGWYLDDLMIGSMGGLCDFGDAPDEVGNPGGYATLLANNGARHGAVPGFHLGATIDLEPDGQPSPLADGDDNNPTAGPDDEDGVTFVPIDPARTGTVLFVGQQGQASIELTNTVTNNAFLDAWIDFNRDGNWSDSERIATSQSLAAGMNTLTFLVPDGAELGETYARFRLSSTGGLSPVGPSNDGEVEDYQVSIEPWQPALEIVKTGVWNNTNNNGRADVADTIEYAFTVTNTGNVTLLNVSVTDPMVTVGTLSGLIDADQDGFEDDLLPGGIATATSSYLLTQVDIDARMKMNTASADATAPNGDPIRDEDTASVLLPSIQIIKTNVSPGGWNDADNDGRPDIGETIDYAFTITNDGKLSLLNVTLADPTVTVGAMSGLTDADQDGSQDDLLPGAIATSTGSYVITQADIDAGQKVNTAMASATDPDGNLVNGEDTVTTDLRSPSIEIVKTGTWTNTNNNGRPDVADTIEYTFQVTNTGNVPLLNVTVTDTMVTVGALIGLTDADQDGVQDDLLPGAVATATGSYLLTQADVDARMKTNTASADAVTLGGTPIRSEDTANVLLPSIDIVKTNTSPGGWNDNNSNGIPEVGETINYAFKVMNDGKLPLLNVTFLDPTVTVTALSGLTDADQDGSQDDLSPGGMATATGTYVLTQADVQAERKVNTATARATDPAGNPINDDATVITPLPMPRSSLSGRVFNDVNGNTAQDSFEVGINFVTVVLFADTNRNGLIDDGATPLQAITMSNGDYTFPGLIPGAYIVEVMASTAPADATLTTANAPSSVVLTAGTNATIDFGYQGVIQFVTPLGFFSTKDNPADSFREGIPSDFVAPFVRPANDFLVDVLIRDSNDNYELSGLLASLEPWQSFTVRNTTGAPLEITALNKSITAPGSNAFVKIFTRQQLDDLAAKELNNVPITESDLRGITNDQLSSNPILLGTSAPDDHVTFFAFYRPVELNTTGAVDVIMRQTPDWSNNPATPENETLVDGKAHTFERQDRLEVVTRFAAGSQQAAQTPPKFQFQLVGGSTYDSDIFDYNGRVQQQDFQLLNSVILARQLPTTESDSQWDPTTDVNVRFPNGAQGAVGRAWPANILRENALGDYGTFNVEFPRKSRAPFLDLDARNIPAAVGVDYQTSTNGGPVFVASSDAQFGNGPDQRLDSLVVTILNPSESDQIRIDESQLASMRIEAVGNGTSALTLRPVVIGDPLGPTISDFVVALRLIAYSSGNSPPTPGTRVITIQAIGSDSDFKFTSNGVTIDQSVGNVAISRILVRPDSA